MYHIKNDKRALTSARLICEAFQRCLQEKPYGQITISDIQRLSTVSRSTFYRNFDSLEDVLSLLCDKGFAEAFSAREENRSAPIAVFRYWYNHGELLEAVLQSGHIELFLDSFRRSLEAAGAARLVNADGAEFDYFISSIAYVMIGTLATWIRRGQQENEQQLLHALKGAFSAIGTLKILMVD